MRERILEKLERFRQCDAAQAAIETKGMDRIGLIDVEARAAIVALLDRMRNHGLIAP